MKNNLPVRTVTVLNTQARGIRVHHPLCRDIQRERRQGLNGSWTIEIAAGADLQQTVNEDVLGDFAGDEGITVAEYIDRFGSEVDFLPCCDKY